MRRRWLLALPALLLVLWLAGFELSTGGAWTGDTTGVIDGVGIADRCLQAGVVDKCGLVESSSVCVQTGVCGPQHNATQVGPFPLLQYLPTWGFKHLGMTPHGALRGLIVISGLAALVLLIVMTGVAARLDARLGALAALCLLASPLLWYSHAGFGESLYAAILGLLALGVLRGWHLALLGLLAFGAGIGKETSFPFVIAIVAIAWLTARRRPARSEIAALIAGLVVALGATVVFNLFRFGSPFNLFYGAAVLHTPFGDRPERFAALLVAPNGGILWFWPAAAIVLVASLAIAVRRSGWSRRLLLEPAVLVMLLLAAVVAGLASWYSSFGAIAWGPRLLVPWVPPMLAILIFGYGLDFVGAFSRRHVLASACWIAVAVLALAHLGVLFDSSRRVHSYALGGGVKEIAYSASAPDRTCPSVILIQVDRSGYYRCARHQAWARSPILTKAITDVWKREPGMGVLFLLALAGLAALVQARWLNQRPLSRSRNTTTQRPVSSTSST
jgi:hypothetical protein